MSYLESQDSNSGTRLGREFFNVSCEELAKSLLGKVLIRKENGFILKGCIVETEAYIGGEDLSSHTHHGKITKRTAPTYMAPGDGACVLLRSLEPIAGLEEMKKKRSIFGKGFKKQLKSYRLKEICNGPSKLAIAMNINTRFSGDDLVTSQEIWIEAGPELVDNKQIVECSRIGIGSTDPFWASKPFRYYILGNSCVSKRDKDAEEKKLQSIGRCRSWKNLSYSNKHNKD